MNATTGFDSIVVGVDDERTDAAVKVAVQLGARLGCVVTPLHVLAKTGVGSERAGTAEDLADAAFENQVRRLGSLGSEAAAGHSEPAKHLRVLFGKPAEQLLERARAASKPLLVIGPHRRRGKIDFGSTARAVLAHAQGPVWVQVGEPRVIRSILVPIELSHPTRAPLELARDMARVHGARVRVLHSFIGPALAYSKHAPLERGPAPTYVTDELCRAESQQLAEVVEAFDWQGVEHETVFEETTPVEHILRQQASADLIVLGSRVRSVAAGIVFGSTVFGVLQGTNIPVLVVRLDD